MAEDVWRVAGRYRVLGRIGSGGMADVLRAHDELLSRDVALKVFRSLPSTPDTATGVERQQAELRALARLNHPNLTVLYDGSIVGQDGPAFLVMELIAGGSLAEAIEAGGLGLEHTAEVGAQVADALAYVHAAGMVHRDVKPANVLLGDDRIADSDVGRARLTDFGIVRLVGDEPLTQADMTLGSASYLAPEQTRGSAVGPPADVYALGLSLLEALTGRRSFEGPALEAAMARLSRDPYVPADLPQPWPGLLRAMTARDPATRPTAAQVAKALRNTDTTAAALTAVPVPAAFPGRDTTAYLPRAAAGSTTVLPPTARQVGPPPPVRVSRPPDGPVATPPPRRVPLWVGALAAVVALALILGVILLATSGSDGGGSGTTPAPSPSTTGTTPPASTTPSTEQAPTTEQESTPPASDSAPPSDSTPPSSEPPSSPSTNSSASTGSSSASTSTSAGAGAPGQGSKTPKPKKSKPKA